MHNEAFGRMGINAVYLPFCVSPDRLAEAVQSLRALNIAGVNVTIPHKERICALLDEISDEARLVGAVNTVVHREGKLKGYNTDSAGFMSSLAEDLRFDAPGKRILVLGAGGACRAVTAGLCLAGSSWIGIADMNLEKARQVVEFFASRFKGTQLASFSCNPKTLLPWLPSVDLLVNATPVGMKGESFEGYEWRLLPGHASVYDLVYSPTGTPLTRMLGTMGYRVADGLGMLAAQGEEAFCLWTGKRPPSGLMRKRLEMLVRRE
jgi:shikimate dehydrogenase